MPPNLKYSYLLASCVLAMAQIASASDYREEFNGYTSNAHLVGQGNPVWESVRAFPSPFVMDAGDLSFINGPLANNADEQTRATRRMQSLNLTSRDTLTVSFDITAESNTVDNHIGFGVGAMGETPAYIGIQNGVWVIRGSQFGTTHIARNPDSSAATPVIGDRYRVYSTWTLNGEGTASLSIRNLSAGDEDAVTLYFDTAQTIDSVSLELSRGSAPSRWDAVWIRLSTQVDAPALNRIYQLSLYAPRALIERGDVLIRGLRARPMNEDDPHDTLATATAFGVDNILWIYDISNDWIAGARALGIRVGSTMDQRGWPDIQTISNFVQTFTVRNIDGDQVIQTHAAENFGPSAWTRHFVPDITIPQWFDFYRDYVAGLLDLNIVSIHRDDHHANYAAIRYGASFTDASVTFFRNYLQENFTPSQLASLGVDDINTFNVREHFKSLGAPNDTELWFWTGSPLMPIFKEAQLLATANFYQNLRTDIEAITGRSLPWSANGVSPWNAIDQTFDFRIGELQSHLNQPQTLEIIARNADEIGKKQALVSMVDRNYETRPTFVADLRLNIATAYAMGLVPLVPWDMYMHDAPRYFGSFDEFGDLYHFVSRNRQYFDHHELVSTHGVDVRHNLYQWLPNRELHYPASRTVAPVWINQNNVFATVRRSADRQGATIHLINWNPTRSAFALHLNPMALVGSPSASVTLLTPTGDSQTWQTYNGGTLSIPQLNPWGILIVEPLIPTEATLPAPVVIHPQRTVVAAGSGIQFASPENGQRIFFRIGQANQLSGLPFSEYHPQQNRPIVNGNVYLEAYTSNSNGSMHSDSVYIRFRSFESHSASPTTLNPIQANRIDINAHWQTLAGPSLRNESFFGGPLRLMGQNISSGITVSGASEIVCDVDPAWRFFSVQAGLDDLELRRPATRLQVWFDSELAYETAIINPLKDNILSQSRDYYEIVLGIPPGISQIRLKSVPSGFFPEQNTVIWANTMVYLNAVDYPTWAAELSSNQRAPEADPFATGMPNFLRYAFGMPASEVIRENLPQLHLKTLHLPESPAEGSDYMVFEVRVRHTINPSNWRVRGSTDLVHWNLPQEQPILSHGPIQENNVDIYQFRSAFPIEEASRYFMHAEFDWQDAAGG
jgi:hypothetical protein